MDHPPLARLPPADCGSTDCRPLPNVPLMRADTGPNVPPMRLDVEPNVPLVRLDTGAAPNVPLVRLDAGGAPYAPAVLGRVDAGGSMREGTQGGRLAAAGAGGGATYVLDGRADAEPACARLGELATALLGLRQARVGHEAFDAAEPGTPALQGRGCRGAGAQAGAGALRRAARSRQGAGSSRGPPQHAAPPCAPQGAPAPHLGMCDAGRAAAAAVPLLRREMEGESSVGKARGGGAPYVRAVAEPGRCSCEALRGMAPL